MSHPPSQLFHPGRCEGLAPRNRCVSIRSHIDVFEHNRPGIGGQQPPLKVEFNRFACDTCQVQGGRERWNDQAALYLIVSRDKVVIGKLNIHGDSSGLNGS
jgi:hypothetical protein